VTVGKGENGQESNIGPSDGAEGVARRPCAGHVIGPEPPGTACAHCGLAYGTVYLYRHEFGAFGSFSAETLHEGCAAAWFEAQRDAHA
jgi:hypothetical protein